MSKPSTAIGGIAEPGSTTFKGDSISTTIVQTSTSISTTIEPTSTLTTLVTGVLSTQDSTSVVPLSTFSESVTSIYTMSEKNSMSTAIFFTSSYSATRLPERSLYKPIFLNASFF